MLWKLLIVALITMLVAGSVAAQETPTPVPLTSAQRRAVRVFADDGVLAGTSCSIRDCSGTVERWEVALWIVRLLDGEPTSHRAFVDVDSEKPYAGYVQTLFDLGVTVGCLVDLLRYCPTRETRRGQMAAFVTRAYDFDDTIPPHGFADVPRSHPFRDNISALKNAGILSSDCVGGEGLFCPDDPVVAAEAVEWLYRASRINPTDGRDGGGGGGGGNTGGGNTGNTGGGGRDGGNTGGGNTPPTNIPVGGTTPSTTIPGGGDVVSGSPGGVEYDIGPNGECTHWGVHTRSGASDDKSHVLLSEDLLLDDGRTLNTGLYAHRHDGSVPRWWFWPHPIDGEQQPVTNLPAGDSQIPCHHAECPIHSHGPNGMDSASYVAAEGHPRARTYTHTHTDVDDLDKASAAWRIDGVEPSHPPCSSEDEHMHPHGAG